FLCRADACQELLLGSLSARPENEPPNLRPRLALLRPPRREGAPEGQCRAPRSAARDLRFDGWNRDRPAGLRAAGGTLRTHERRCERAFRCGLPTPTAPRLALAMGQLLERRR